MGTAEERQARVDSAIKALGRLAWAAINLEDRAESLAGMVLRRPKSRAPIGVQIQEAIAYLIVRQGAPVVGSTLSWLAGAGGALFERNRVLHSTPAQTADGEHWMLVHSERKTGVESEIPFDAEALKAIADRAYALVESWADVAVAYAGSQQALEFGSVHRPSGVA